MKAALDGGGKVLLVKTEHETDRSTWTLNMLEDDQGFIFRGTAQADFVPGLLTGSLPQRVKIRDSAFLGTDLLLRLRHWNLDTLGRAVHSLREYRQPVLTLPEIQDLFGILPSSSPL